LGKFWHENQFYFLTRYIFQTPVDENYDNQIVPTFCSVDTFVNMQCQTDDAFPKLISWGKRARNGCWWEKLRTLVHFQSYFFCSNNQILYKTSVLIDRPIILQLINNYYSSTILQAYHKYDLEFYHCRNVTLFAL